jgi:glycosyltransferase involved in cell wall biosynthesis
MLICFPHAPQKYGGPGSFQSRFEQYLVSNNVQVDILNYKSNPDIIFIVGGSRKIFLILYHKLKGVRVVQRLDGLNTEHRKNILNLKSFLYAEVQYWIVIFLFLVVADQIIFQSDYIKNTWLSRYGNINKDYRVIYNGFTPQLDHYREVLLSKIPTSKITILCVEGHINGPAAEEILCSVEDYFVDVFGSFDLSVKHRVLSRAKSFVLFHGYLKSHTFYKVYCGRRIFLLLETNPPCPNAVVEALSYGCPVVAFDSGAISELVDETCGFILPYDGNAKNFEAPKVDSLNYALNYVSLNYDNLSKGAFERAAKFYSFEKIGNEYINYINNNYENTI